MLVLERGVGESLRIGGFFELRVAARRGDVITLELRDSRSLQPVELPPSTLPRLSLRRKAARQEESD